MTIRHRVASLLLLGLFAGCGRPYVADPLEVNARYALKYKEPCNAWLRSAKTGYMFCSSPAFAVVAPGVEVLKKSVFKPMSEGPTDEASLKARGELVYGEVCATCHMANGQGTDAFPPLAGSGAFYGDAQNHARIIVHGLAIPIEVQGVKYSGNMPPQGAALSDYDIAAAATYERLSWGNNDGMVTPADVAAVR